MITDPVFSALILPSIGDGFNVDVDTDREFVHHCPNCNIKPILGVGNVRLSGLSRSALAWGCRAIAERECLSRSTSPAGTRYCGMAQVRA